MYFLVKLFSYIYNIIAIVCSQNPYLVVCYRWIRLSSPRHGRREAIGFAIIGTSQHQHQIEANCRRAFRLVAWSNAVISKLFFSWRISSMVVWRWSLLVHCFRRAPLSCACLQVAARVGIQAVSQISSAHLSWNISLAEGIPLGKVDDKVFSTSSTQNAWWFAPSRELLGKR